MLYAGLQQEMTVEAHPKPSASLMYSAYSLQYITSFLGTQPRSTHVPPRPPADSDEMYPNGSSAHATFAPNPLDIREALTCRWRGSLLRLAAGRVCTRWPFYMAVVKHGHVDHKLWVSLTPPLPPPSVNIS